MNKTLYIYENNVNVGTINNLIFNNFSSSFVGLTNLTSCYAYVENNNVAIGSLTNSHNFSGILANYTRDLSDVDIVISENNITIDNIDTFSSNISGIVGIDTIIDGSGIFASFKNGTDLTLTISDNTITSNTPESLSDELRGNGAIFSLNPGADHTSYVGPTGQLTVTGNILSDNFFDLEKTYLSDYYFPPEFRPFIYKLQSEFPGSNYWFGPGEPTIELLGTVNTGHVIGSESNDATLRSIFRRAITAINEQTRFEIYPFYHIKVKANKM
jgi:hypothetical protein